MELSLSYICDRPYNIYQAHQRLETAGYQMSVHMDLMDGHFVPRLGVHPEALDEINYFREGDNVKTISNTQIDAHAMITYNNPAWADIKRASRPRKIFVHYESFPNEEMLVQALHSDGRMKLAFKPWHTIKQMDKICERLFVNEFLLMTYAPGIKVQDMTYDLDQLQDTDKYVTIDGGVTLDTVERFREHNNITLVCGSKVIFTENYEENMKCLTS
jgi:pentose-5-phosphate-3-epimerase